MWRRRVSESFPRARSRLVARLHKPWAGYHTTPLHFLSPRREGGRNERGEISLRDSLSAYSVRPEGSRAPGLFHAAFSRHALRTGTVRAHAPALGHRAGDAVPPDVVQ